jgi:succinoglycan biosynthesis protein ExoO
MQPDVSFIIAAFNAQKTIARAVKSALEQNAVSVEVIVVDDRSTDATRDCVRDIVDDRIVLVEKRINEGPGAARNAALALAKGPYIAILDADDTVEPERMDRLISRARAADAQIVLDDLEVVDERGASPEVRPMFGRERLSALPSITLASFIAGNPLFGGEFSLGYLKPVIERKFLQTYGIVYDQELRIGEDYLLVADALAHGARCVVEPTPGYRYHLVDGSVSRVLKPHHVAAMLEADERFLARHVLDTEAAAAQALRTRSLEEAAAFLDIVGHLKARSALGAIRAAWRDPSAIRHLKMPIMVRLRRLFGHRTALAGGG